MSRFVSAGIDADSRPSVDEAWLKAQQEVEIHRKPKKLDEGKQEAGKSLYEVLQANKAAKQEAFEESLRLKNQFRALDEDEVDFLDSVLELNRVKEDAVKQETAQQLEAFRKQRAVGEQALLDQARGDDRGNLDDPVGGSSWTWKKKKRRREKGSESGGDPKLRKLSSSTHETPVTEPSSVTTSQHLNDTDVGRGTNRDEVTTISKEESVKANTVGLGLGDYDSEDE